MRQKRACEEGLPETTQWAVHESGPSHPVVRAILPDVRAVAGEVVAANVTYRRAETEPPLST